MTADFRALCVELTDCLEKADWPLRYRYVFRQWIDIARAALADEPPEPAPPADGEVAELVAWLQEEADDYECVGCKDSAAKCKRAAELLQRQAPVQPADGEVAELAAKLRRLAPQNPLGTADPTITRAADLLERQALVPVSVSERLPRPSVKVLAHYFNGLGKERTICAIWVPAKTRSDSYGDDDFTEYDEESDTFYWPEGWYETIENWDDLGYVKVDEGEVVYWQPIPKLSAHALPLPEVGE